MALPILDGNQTSVTLATTVSGGAHYPNHILASSVTISSLPAISGTVTIGAGTAQIGSVTASISGTVPISISSVTIGNFPATQPISIASVTIGSALPAGTNRIGVVTIGGGTVTIGSGTAQIGSVTASIQAGTAQIGSVTASISGTVPISISSVTIGNSVTISSLPAISGTVTASNLVYKSGEWLKAGEQYFQRVGDQRWEGGSKANNLSAIYFDDESYLQGWVLDYQVNGRTYYFYAETMLPPAGTWVTEENNDSIQVSYESPFPISGTVTVGNSITIGSCVTHGVNVANSVTIGSLPVQLSTTTIGGTARLNVTLSSATTIGATAPSYGNLYGGSDGTNLRAISVDTSGRTVVTGSVSVASTTVTISAQPSGALTTRFGSVVTANTAGITTAVTNTSRKYLLAQNISTGTVTIGIGFSPTTTQGIQLTAGAGLTFDSFVPTGAVWWLGATTGATWTILEG
jgi:hypothetical protein